MSAEKQTMLARVGKKSRAGRENRSFDLFARHARIMDLEPESGPKWSGINDISSTPGSYLLGRILSFSMNPIF